MILELGLETLTALQSLAYITAIELHCGMDKKLPCAHPMRDVVGDICEDIFGCINAIKHLILRQHIVDGLPLRQDRGHLQQLLCMLCGETYRLTTHKRLIRCYSVDQLLLLFILGYLVQLLISHEFICGRFQFLFNGSEHFLQVDARYPGEDVLHS